jgi:tRNA-dihydrouridine synthase
MNFWQQLPKPFFVLAPMDDVTDVVFRQFVGEVAAPDVMFTEFVSIGGLGTHGHDSTILRLRIAPAQAQPTVVQIWGNDPERFRYTADYIKDMGFAGIDINMGCPDRNVVRRGSGGGLIGNTALAEEIIAATKAGAPNLPVSVKTRLGRNAIITEDWAGWLLTQDITALTIHGRTVKEMSKVDAHWDEIAKVVKLRDQLAPQTIIIGNGDVANRTDGLQRAADSGVDGIMIGRGIFRSIDAFAQKAPTLNPARQIQLLERHLDLYEQWGSTKPLQTLKKFFKIYISTWPEAAQLRSQLMEAKTIDEVRLLLKFYTENSLPNLPISADSR